MLIHFSIVTQVLVKYLIFGIHHNSLDACRSTFCHLLAWDRVIHRWLPCGIRQALADWKPMCPSSCRCWLKTDVPFREDSNKSLSVPPQTVSLSPTADISVDSPSSLYDTTSAESTPLNTKHPSFEVQLPENSKQRVNKGFRVSEILENTNSYRNSILEFFTNFAK